MKWPTEDDFGKRPLFVRLSSVAATPQFFANAREFIKNEDCRRRQLRRRYHGLKSVVSIVNCGNALVKGTECNHKLAINETTVAGKKQTIIVDNESLQLQQKIYQSSPDLSNKYISRMPLGLCTPPKKSSTQTANCSLSPDLFTSDILKSSICERTTPFSPLASNTYRTPLKQYSSLSRKRNIWRDEFQALKKAYDGIHNVEVTFSQSSLCMDRRCSERNDEEEDILFGCYINEVSGSESSAQESLNSTKPLHSEAIGDEQFQSDKKDIKQSLPPTAVSINTSKELFSASDECKTGSFTQSYQVLLGSRQRSKEIVEIINCESPSESALKGQQIMVHSTDTQSFGECSDADNISESLGFLISPVKTPPTFEKRSSLMCSIKFQRCLEEELDEQVPRMRRRKLGKLGIALRRRIQTARSDIAMWKYDDHPQKAALNLKLLSCITLWGMHWLIARSVDDGIKCTHYIAIDSNDPVFSRSGLKREYELHSAFSELEVSLFNPLHIYADFHSSSLLLGPYYLKLPFTKFD